MWTKIETSHKPLYLWWHFKHSEPRIWRAKMDGSLEHLKWNIQNLTLGPEVPGSKLARIYYGLIITTPLLGISRGLMSINFLYNELYL